MVSSWHAAPRRRRHHRPVTDEIPSARKRQVLALVAAGWPNKQIAARLGVTSWAIEKHLRQLYRWYRVPNRAALVRVALRSGHLTERGIAAAEIDR
jgi:DNA-binding NarL/FixJ family response regulator